MEKSQLNAVSSLLTVSLAMLGKPLIDFVDQYGPSAFDGIHPIPFAMTLASGTLFALDVLCLLWWYSHYIYRIQPRATFKTFLLDVMVCVVFAAAGQFSLKPELWRSFIICTALGSGLLLLRVYGLYRTVELTATDRRILRTAKFTLGMALAVCVWPTIQLMVPDFPPPARDTQMVSPELREAREKAKTDIERAENIARSTRVSVSEDSAMKRSEALSIAGTAAQTAALAKVEEERVKTLQASERSRQERVAKAEATLAKLEDEEQDKNDPWHRGLPGVLSLIGIVTTMTVIDKLQIASEIHEVRRQRFVPLELCWPEEVDEQQRSIIRRETQKALVDFKDMFGDPASRIAHDRLLSRVHSEADIHVQSHILAVPCAADPERLSEETRDIAFMVAASHWLDDLLDGRKPRHVSKVVADCEHVLPFFGTEGATQPIESKCRELYRRFYAREVIRHAGQAFEMRLVTEMEAAVKNTSNRAYLYIGLCRVALGAAMFSPMVSEANRDRILTVHNRTVLNLMDNERLRIAAGEMRRWFDDAHALVQRISSEQDGPGQILLGLTTKTVQEVAQASEHHNVVYSTSVLYSLLYAPLLYFHDIRREEDEQEMIALDRFDVSYREIVPWLCDARELLKSAPLDPRRDMRLQQLGMAFHSFRPMLPEPVSTALAEVYGARPIATALPMRAPKPASDEGTASVRAG